MSICEQIFFELKNNNIKYTNYSQLLKKLSLKLNISVENIAKSINKMLQSGDLIENHKHQVVISESVGIFKGKVNGNSKGFAFITPINKGRSGFEIKKGELEDVFVPASMLLGALDGDVVLYRLEGKDNGSVVKILKKANQKIVGKIAKNIKLKNKSIDDENFYLIPDNNKISKTILIPKRDINGANVGDNVMVQITYQPEDNSNNIVVGKVVEIINGNDIEKGVLSILCENQIPYKFPNKVIKEANELKNDIENERKKRVDLTKELIITIDGADAKDLDDAVSLKKIDDKFILGVHIADVGHFVKYKSEIDIEAYFRGTSVYIPGRVYPMLPEKLSNNLCSLNPNEEKLTLSVEMVIDSYGEVIDYKIFESIIKSSKRMTYDEVQNIIENKNSDSIIKNNKILDSNDIKKILETNNEDNKEINNMIFLMKELSEILSLKMKKNGALNLEMPETYFEIKGNEVLNVKKLERKNSHIIIENFMILANKTIAEVFCKLEIPFVYRIHGEPSKVRIQEVIDVLNSFGLKISNTGRITSLYIQNILNQIKNTKYSETGSKIILRALEKAIYNEECLGHFGLALEYYCHFTSPIRRYPDLTIHRIIKEALKYCQNHILTSVQSKQKILKNFKNNYELEEFVINSSLQSSERERKADEAERAADDLFKAKYMENKIGQNFKGTISGVSSFGIFVELENTVEGLIKIETLPADDYIYDKMKFVLKGKKRKFIIGQVIKVKVISVNVKERKIEFLFCE